MNPYARAATDFTRAYKDQIAASNAQASASASSEQQYALEADSRGNQTYGSPQPQAPESPDESLNGFDPDMDDKVESMKQEMLNKAKISAYSRKSEAKSAV
jgi:hypothetical protein